MEFSVGEIAQLVGGHVEGDASVRVSTVAKIQEGSPGKLCFVANPKYEKFLYSTEASAVIVRKDLDLKEPITATLIRVEDPYQSISVLLEEYEKAVRNRKGIHPSAFIEPSATIGEDVYIGPHVVIGQNVTIGDGCQIHANVVIDDKSAIGNNCLIYSGVQIQRNTQVGDCCIFHSGVVIGSDGFGFAPTAEGPFKKIPHVGNVVIGNWVEIGANSTVDRATMGSTILHDGVKLDNLVQVGHNVEIGCNTVIAALTGVSGSTKLGKNCMVGGQVGFVGHITVADGSKFNARTGVIKSIKEPGQAWNGVPAVNFRDSYRIMALIRQLPQMEQRLRDLERSDEN